MANMLLSVVTLWLALKGSMSINTLESTPPSVNGVLTACAGQQISLTCSHNINIFPGGNTLWRASGQVNCTTVVAHTATPPSGQPCGPFMFEGITPIVATRPSELNSTAVATATVGMTNTNVECESGILLESVPVGNISLCVVGPPTNIVCQNTSSGLRVSWEPVVDTSSCARSGVNYSVTVTRESDMMTIISSMLVTGNSADLANTMGLDPSARYLITVNAQITGDTCMGQQVNVPCDSPPPTSPTEPPSSPTPVSTTVTSSQNAPPPSTTAPPSSRGLSAGAIAAIVVVFIVLIIVAVVIVIVVVIVIRISPQGKRRDQDGVHDSLGGEQHMNTYAMVDKNTTQ